jgi:transcription elongation factor Elf1
MAKPPDEWAGLDARIAALEKLARTFDCPQCGAAAGHPCLVGGLIVEDAYGNRHRLANDGESVVNVCGRRYRLAVEADKVGAA